LKRRVFGVREGREESSPQISAFSRGSPPRHSSRAEGAIGERDCEFLFFPRLLEHRFERGSLFFTDRNHTKDLLDLLLASHLANINSLNDSQIQHRH
jgi:hypothetical protein